MTIFEFNPFIFINSHAISNQEIYFERRKYIIKGKQKIDLKNKLIEMVYQ
jgi:hypothetical protein